MATKPTVGGDYNTHGTKLNEFLDVGHDSDGTLKKSQALTDLGYSPTSYAGGESVTFPNGLIIKQGTETNVTLDAFPVSFGTAFPNANLIVIATGTGAVADPTCVSAKSTSGFTLDRAGTGSSGSQSVYWIAIGY